MKRFLIGFSILSILATFIALPNELAGKAPDKDLVLAKVGPENITYGKLEQAFQKNMNRKSTPLYQIPADSLRDFLDLYIKYRLKVLDAKGRGYENDSTVIQDIEQNRRLLAESFYYDKMLTEPVVSRMLQYRKEDVKFAYILLAVKNQNEIAPVDTAETYRIADSTLKAILAGASFEKTAESISDDKETGKNGGLVDKYITGGKVQRPIEDALYTLKPGQVYDKLVSTRYGYFILKLIERVPRELVLGSHILISETNEPDSLKREQIADEILAKLKEGTQFSKLAETMSNDPASAMKGGSLGNYYSRSTGFEGSGRNVVPAFEKTLFSLKDGEYSGKVRTDFGIHIIKRDSTKKINMEEEQEELKKLYKRLYFENDKREYNNKLLDRFSFAIYNDVIDELVKNVDSSKTNLDANWSKNIPEDLKKKDVYTFLGDKTPLSKFIEELNTNPQLRGLPTNKGGFTRAINKLVEPKAFDEATKTLEEEHEDFARLMNEFRDGILLFRVEALEVWENLKFDSVLAKTYYDSTKSRYKTKPMYDIDEIYVLSDSLASELYNKINNGEDFGEIAEENTQRSGYREKKGSWGLIPIDKNSLAEIASDMKAKPGTVLRPVTYDKGYSIIRVNKYEPERMKTFEEAIPDFAPEFQDMMQRNLTDKWLTKVKGKYPVSINENNIKSLKK